MSQSGVGEELTDISIKKLTPAVCVCVCVCVCVLLASCVRQIILHSGRKLIQHTHTHTHTH